MRINILQPLYKILTSQNNYIEIQMQNDINKQNNPFTQQHLSFFASCVQCRDQTDTLVKTEYSFHQCNFDLQSRVENVSTAIPSIDPVIYQATRRAPFRISERCASLWVALFGKSSSISRTSLSSLVLTYMYVWNFSIMKHAYWHLKSLNLCEGEDLNNSMFS